MKISEWFSWDFPRSCLAPVWKLLVSFMCQEAGRGLCHPVAI